MRLRGADTGGTEYRAPAPLGRVLVGDAKCSHGGDAGRQVNPYFTADLRHVIYNGDPDGVVNVFAAEIPTGFLES